MAMKKLKLKVQKRPIRKTATQKRLQKAETKKRRVATKRANKVYYQRNRKTILKRGAATRVRKAKGDKRSTRRSSI